MPCSSTRFVPVLLRQNMMREDQPASQPAIGKSQSSLGLTKSQDLGNVSKLVYTTTTANLVISYRYCNKVTEDVFSFLSNSQMKSEKVYKGPFLLHTTGLATVVPQTSVKSS